jgi:hypothetical protein
VQRVLPPQSRSAGFGVLFTGASVGAMFAPLIALGIHRATGSWRWAFVGTAGVGLAWLPIWALATSNARVREAMSRPAGAPPTSEPPISRWRLLTAPPVLRAMLMVLASAPCISFCLNWYAQYLSDVFVLPQDALGRYLWVPPVFFDLGSVFFGALASRADRRAQGETRTHAHLMLSAAALCAAMAAMPLAHDPWVATGLAAMALAGGGAVFALLTGDMIARVHPAHASTAGGLSAAAQSLAYIVVNPIIGNVVDRTRSYGVLLEALGLAAFPVALIWALWPVKVAPAARPSTDLVV